MTDWLIYDQVHDAYIELAGLLVQLDPQAAVEVYCRFPQSPADEQTFDDAFITGEIVRILMKLELYDHPQLGPNLIAYGKVMGPGEESLEVQNGRAPHSLHKFQSWLNYKKCGKEGKYQDVIKT